MFSSDRLPCRFMLAQGQRPHRCHLCTAGGTEIGAPEGRHKELPEDGDVDAIWGIFRGDMIWDDDQQLGTFHDLWDI